MKPTIVAAVALAACKTASPAPDRWAEVTAAAADLVPTGPAGELAAALESARADDIPEAAFDHLYAWAEANGGLPWRGDRSTGAQVAPRLMAFKIGEEALVRRPTDPRTLPAVLYLARRFRGEGSCQVDTAMGFDLAAEVRKQAPAAVTKAAAPTEAEIRRGLALIAECGRALVVDNVVKGEGTETLREQAREALQALVVDAPRDYHQLGNHVDKVLAAHDSAVVGLLMSETRGQWLRKWAAELDAWPK